jgi:hypothetical protein
MLEVRGQITEVRGQMADVRSKVTVICYWILAREESFDFGMRNAEVEKKKISSWSLAHGRDDKNLETGG